MYMGVLSVYAWCVQPVETKRGQSLRTGVTDHC